MTDTLTDLKRAVSNQKYFHISCETSDADVVHAFRRLTAYELQINQVVQAALNNSLQPEYDVQADTLLDDELIAFINIKGPELQAVLRQYQKYKEKLDTLLLLANSSLQSVRSSLESASGPINRYSADITEEYIMENKSSLVPIYQAGNKFEAETVRLLLESFEIPVELIGESVGKTMGLGGGPTGEVAVYVPAGYAEEARDLIDRMDKGEFEVDESNQSEPPQEPD